MNDQLTSIRSCNRKKRKSHENSSSDYIFSLPNSSSVDSEPIVSSPDETASTLSCFSFESENSSSDSASESNFTVDNFSELNEFFTQPDLLSYTEAVLSNILSCPGISLSSAEKIVQTLNVFNERFSHESFLLPNIRYFWEKRSKSNPVGVFIICDNGHSHGPFYGEPMNYGHFNCGNEEIPVILRQDKYFLHIPLMQQLQNHLSSLPYDCWRDLSLDGIQESIGSEILRIRNSGDNIEVKRFTLTMQTDEVAVGNSSSTSIFPIFITINELSTKFKRENFFLTCLFVGKKKPDLSTFLGPVVEELDSLANFPINWKDCDGNNIKSTFHLSTVIADAPMRAFLRSVRQFNHIYGCDWCLIKASSLNGARVFPYLSKSQIEKLRRSRQDFLNFQCTQRNQRVEQEQFHGLIGNSPLLSLDDFDIVNGFAVEPMHCIILGIFRSILFKCWLKNDFGSIFESGVDHGFFKCEFSKRIISIKVPSDLPRPPRELTNIKYWKSCEYDSLLCYYLVPSIRGLLKARVVNNIICLTRIYSKLHTRFSDESDIEELTSLIDEFQKGVCEIYGPGQQSYNLHILSHLPESVRSLGNFDCISAYPLENQMGVLKDKVRRNSYAAQALVRVFLNDFNHREIIAKKVNFWQLTPKESKIFGVSNRIEYSSNITKIPETETIQLNSLKQKVFEAFLSHLNLTITDKSNRIKFFKSIAVDCKRFSTKIYCCNKTRDDSTIRLKNSLFFRTEVICELDGTIFLLGYKFRSSPFKHRFRGFSNEFNYSFDYIHEIHSIENELSIIKIEDIQSKAIFIDSQAFHYKYPKSFLVQHILENK